MTKSIRARNRDTFRHGDLRNALVAAGLELARCGGPGSVAVREATRRVGVTPNAAYNYFSSRQELLDAIRSACLAKLRLAVELEMQRCKPGRNIQSYARRSLRAAGVAYLRFALLEPGLFRTAIAAQPKNGSMPVGPDACEDVPFHLFSPALDQMQRAGLVQQKNRKGAEFLVWSSVHGLALLALEVHSRRCPIRLCTR
jgi:AcrR family transcriptional regulator